jgi:hypothetical protein
VLFGLGNSVDLSRLHPSPVQIFTLWQAFLDNVHPLLMVVHAPTIQQLLLKCASNLTVISPAMHALLFSIYANAVTSMRNDDCMASMNEERLTLLGRYTAVAQYALQKAGFLRSSDAATLQAFILHLVSTESHVSAVVSLNITSTWVVLEDLNSG